MAEVSEARKVETLVRRVARLVDQEEARDDAEDPDRDVDEEDPVPADVVGEKTADERADRERERGDARPDADRGAALPRRERRRDDRERRRVHQGGAGALRDARGDEHVARRREPAGKGREGEHRDADDEQETPAVGVGELSADQHERREGERVAAHDPLELREPDAEVALDRRQRDVHDGVVEHDHEQPERHRRERPPLLVLFGNESSPHCTTPSRSLLATTTLASTNPGRRRYAGATPLSVRSERCPSSSAPTAAPAPSTSTATRGSRATRRSAGTAASASSSSCSRTTTPLLRPGSSSATATRGCSPSGAACSSSPATARRTSSGRTSSTALSLSDTAPLELVREWGVRRMGQELEVRTRAGLRKPVLVDLFPAYDDDGGILVALTAADRGDGRADRRDLARPARADELEPRLAPHLRHRGPVDRGAASSRPARSAVRLDGQCSR